jgi:hypothetical protein
MRAFLVIVSVIASVILGTVSNYLYDLCKKHGYFPSRPNAKRTILLVTVFVPFVLLIALPEVLNLGSDKQTLPPPTVYKAKNCFPPDVRSLINTEGPIQIENTKEIDLDDDGIAERYVVSRLVNEPRSFYVHILSCAQEGIWESRYELGPLTGCGCGVLEMGLIPNNTKQLVVTQVCGSGAFLSYKVIGVREDGQLGILLEEENLFQGSIEIYDRWLLVETGRGVWKYEWDAGRFVKSDASIPIEPNTVVVDYWWKGGKAFTDAKDNTVRLRVGQTLFLRRNKKQDDSVFSVRQLLSASPGSAEWKDRGMVAKAPGEAGIIVIPGGYGAPGVDSLEISVEIE